MGTAISQASGGYSWAGHAQATAYGSSAEHCKVQDFGASGSAQQDLAISVNCFSPTGAPENSLFTVAYQYRTDQNGPEGSYFQSYWPSGNRNYDIDCTAGFDVNCWNSTGGYVHVRHTAGSGVYSITIDGQTGAGIQGDDCTNNSTADNGTLEVTALGPGNDYCKIQSWDHGNSRKPLSAKVECFNGSTGAHEDSAYLFNYDTMSVQGTDTVAFAYVSAPGNAQSTVSSPWMQELVNTSDGNFFPHCGATGKRRSELVGMDHRYLLR